MKLTRVNERRKMRSMDTSSQNEDLRSLNLVDLLVIIARYKRVIFRTVV